MSQGPESMNSADLFSNYFSVRGYGDSPRVMLETAVEAAQKRFLDASQEADKPAHTTVGVPPRRRKDGRATLAFASSSSPRVRTAICPRQFSTSFHQT